MSSVIFKRKFPMIGVVHLPPMPGFEGSPGFEAVLSSALREVQTLESAGFDAALIENEGDRPHPLAVTREYRNNFVELMSSLSRSTKLPLGLEILYDMVASVEVAIESRAAFMRLDVFTDDTETRWGIVKSCVDEVQRLRSSAQHGGPLLFADIHVKHGKNLTARSLADSGALAIQHGADALIVTGALTGLRPSDEDCQTLRRVASAVPVYVGSGFSVQNAKEILTWCDGAIVASSIKSNDRIDPDLALALSGIVQTLR